MTWADSFKKNFYWIAGLLSTVLGFVFFEGWLIVFAKVLGPLKATALVSILTIPPSWLIIYLSTRYGNTGRFGEWLSKKEESLSRRTQRAVEGGKFVAILNTTVFLGPIVTSILMLMLGFENRKVYLYAVISAIICAAIWCSFYSGVFWGFEKVLLLKGE